MMFHAKLVEIGLALSISTEVENVKSLQTDRQWVIRKAQER